MIKHVARVIVAVVVISGLWWFFAPGASDGPTPWLGYVEAKSVLVGPKAAGRLDTLNVADGDTVASGQPLFGLDAEAETAAVAAAKANLAQARANLADLRAPRQQPEQIAVLESRLDQARAAADLSKAELDRQEQLYKQRSTPKSRLDEARTAYIRDTSAVGEIGREIEVARMPARDTQIAAAVAAVGAASAALAKANVALADRDVAAPAGGRVLDTFYRVGELVPAGSPVAEILPPERIEARFYVPETEIANVSVGQEVSISCDGCSQPVSGTVTYVAGEAEFTPPVIFSRQERAKLVFLVKARPHEPNPALKPGLPVEVLAK